MTSTLADQSGKMRTRGRGMEFWTFRFSRQKITKFCVKRGKRIISPGNFV